MDQEWARDGGEARCGNCRHWARARQDLLDDNDEAGQCRRRAPVRNISEVEVVGRIAAAVHDVGLRIMSAAGKTLLEPLYSNAQQRETKVPVPEHDRNYRPSDDDRYVGDGDHIVLQQSWPLTYEWAWCGEHEPLAG